MHIQLVLTATSPWSWFASTRSLVNVFEASLTTIALAYWPWTWISRPTGSKERLHDLKMYATWPDGSKDDTDQFLG